MADVKSLILNESLDNNIKCGEEGLGLKLMEKIGNVRRAKKTDIAV